MERANISQVTMPLPRKPNGVVKNPETMKEVPANRVIKPNPKFTEIPGTGIYRQYAFDVNPTEITER